MGAFRAVKKSTKRFHLLHALLYLGWFKFQNDYAINLPIKPRQIKSVDGPNTKWYAPPMKSKKRLGIILIIIGSVLLAFMFIPLISVHHGTPAGFHKGGAADVMTWKTHSLFQFIVYLLSSNYNLGGYMYLAFIAIAVMCATVTLIITGIVLLLKKHRS